MTNIRHLAPSNRCQRVTRDGAPHTRSGGGWGAKLSDTMEPPPLRAAGWSAAGPAARRCSTEHRDLRSLWSIWVLSLALGCWLFAPEARAADVERRDGLIIVQLSGTPYELGRQHGTVLHDEVRASVGEILRYFRRYLKIPWIRTLAANWWLDSAWRQAAPFVPANILEEFRGLSDGSGVPLAELYRLHAIPDRTYSCSSFAAWGKATAGGRLVHLRNLDWNIRAGIQRHAVVFVVHPTGQHAFINVGWAGFVGVMTGINDAQLSVGQVGAETTDATFRGEPMAFVMRGVLERSSSLDEAEAVVRNSRRTVGTNYVFADAKARRGMILETTHQHVRRFEANDVAERTVAYARPIVDAVFRADAAVDPVIRDRQLASHGNPKQPGLEDPSGSSAYDIRYLGQAAGIMAHFGALDGTAAQEIARAIAPSSNIQSVIFAWPDAWVANAENLVPAAQTTYRRLNLKQLLSE